jgi:hypothetical protein
MELRVEKNNTEIVIKNMKLFSREEEEEIIEKYKGQGPKEGPNGPNLRKNLEIASYYDHRTIITLDIIVTTNKKQIKSNFAIIIMYDESMAFLYDIYDELNVKQNDMIWKSRGEVISHFNTLINKSKYNIFSKKGIVPRDQKSYRIQIYNRNGKEVFLCLIRDIFIPVTDEENIRQKILLSLLNESQIPKEFTEVEENISHYTKTNRDRADIIVLHPETGEPWILYELKAPNQPISNDTLEQAKKYNKHLNCNYICLYNGIVEEWYIVENINTIEIIKPKTIDDLYEQKINYIHKAQYVRPNIEECNDEKVIKKHMYGKNVIGKKTSSHLYEFIINLYGFLREEKLYINSPYKLDDFTILNDGIRKTSFGNVSGGQYDGVYRYFILEFPNGDNNIVSISIFDTLGNYTSLIVAVDDYETRHNSLQLNIDKNIQIGKSSWKIFHDGALTFSNKGMQEKKAIISFCENHLPNLMLGNKINLGELPVNVLFDWDNSKEFIINLIRYALIRDKFRDTKRRL